MFAVVRSALRLNDKEKKKSATHTEMSKSEFFRTRRGQVIIALLKANVKNNFLYV